jgi:hypothetical protein
MLPMTSVNSSLSCFSLGATSLLSGLHTPSRYFHTSHLSSSGRPCLAHCRSRGTSTTYQRPRDERYKGVGDVTCCGRAAGSTRRTVSTSTMLRMVSLDTAIFAAHALNNGVNEQQFSNDNHRVRLNADK